MKKFVTIVIFIILFLVDSLIFNGLGRWSALLSTGTSVIGWFANSTQMSYDNAAKTGSQFLPIIASLIINLITYYVIAIIITFIAGRFVKKE